ncbi:hypothetical protein N8014_01745 [Pseudomonadota bacterium]|nr:hypothetical protein [Pseudomonadota bacterium]
MEFDCFVGIDWSGDKSNFQKGISVAKCMKGHNVPKIVKSDKKYWNRNDLLEWIKEEIKTKKILMGFDFAFAYPFYDQYSYFPGIRESPTTPYKLWEIMNNINYHKENFYGGGIWAQYPYLNFYNAPSLKGTYYKSRRRITEIDAKEKTHSPSPTFNCVGPGAVGTGTLAGMRFLNSLQNTVNIWPFNEIINSKSSVAVEIFPTYYFRMFGIKPIKKLGYTFEQINNTLNYFKSKNLPLNTIIGGPDQDDADAIISCAALRYLSTKKETWKVPKVSKKEGWIFGV